MRMEKWLETHIERLFGPRESVQPVEIARRMVRAMEDQRRISVNRVYVPNSFNVYVSVEDLQGLVSFSNTLSQDLANHARVAARRQSFAFPGPLEVDFLPDSTLSRGEYRIETHFVEGEAEVNSAEPEDEVIQSVDEAPASLRHESEDKGETRMYRAEESSRTLWRVTIEDGPDKGVVFTVRLPASIGRRPDCDIKLRDPKVSRIHARFEANDSGVVLVDTGSTNGTRVNGTLAKQAPVHPSARVELGSTRLTIRPAGGE